MIIIEADGRIWYRTRGRRNTESDFSFFFFFFRWLLSRMRVLSFHSFTVSSENVVLSQNSTNFSNNKQLQYYISHEVLQNLHWHAKLIPREFEVLSELEAKELSSAYSLRDTGSPWQCFSSHHLLLIPKQTGKSFKIQSSVYNVPSRVTNQPDREKPESRWEPTTTSKTAGDGSRCRGFGVCLSIFSERQ